MNAYELADELQKMFVGEEYDRLIHEIPDVLRQQADRIVELEKKGKPTAWMFQGAFDISTYVSFEKPNPDIYPNPTPLYTAPQTKPLNDEEINELIVNKVTDYELCRAIEERHGIK